MFCVCAARLPAPMRASSGGVLSPTNCLPSSLNSLQRTGCVELCCSEARSTPSLSRNQAAAFAAKRRQISGKSALASAPLSRSAATRRHQLQRAEVGLLALEAAVEGADCCAKLGAQALDRQLFEAVGLQK